MIIIYGLGNNEAKYQYTKHNIGRLIVENLIKTNSIPVTKVKSVIEAKTSEIVYLYSTDYMNTSGRILNEYIQFKKPQDISLIIVQDDSDQIIGNYKLTMGGGTAGHNGLEDIYKYILNWNVNIQDIIRIKIGIRPPNNKEKSIDFVLSKISKEELIVVNNLTDLINSLQNEIKTKDWSKVQLKINTK
jgi:peptidyl-tRNA hydrolase, PTH1 family